jgi:hypothetical protein
MTTTAEKKQKSQKTILSWTVHHGEVQQVFEIDLSDLTIEEEIQTEEYFDMPLPLLTVRGWTLSTKGLSWFAYLARKRRESDVTYASVLADLETNREIELREEDAETERPTEAPPTNGTPPT